MEICRRLNDTSEPASLQCLFFCFFPLVCIWLSETLMMATVDFHITYANDIQILINAVIIAMNTHILIGANKLHASLFAFFTQQNLFVFV